MALASLRNLYTPNIKVLMRGGESWRGSGAPMRSFHHPTARGGGSSWL